MDVLVIGVSHRTAPLEVRERLHVQEQALPSALRTLPQAEGLEEGMILSTCNRVEIYGRSRKPEQTLPELDRFFERLHGISRDVYHPFLYQHFGGDAVRHLFRVTSSLDSLVVGEPQIAGQVRAAFQTALKAGSAGPGMMPLLDHAMRVAKRVRSETSIARSAVSVSTAAVELAQRIFGAMDARSVLLVGASEMGELAAKHLLDRGARRILVANRTHERAVALAARYQGDAIPFARIEEHLSDVDVVIACTGSPHHILRRDQIHSAMRRRRHRPLFLVDIAVPRNVDPSVHRLDNVYLYNIDDLQQVVEENLQARREEADRAEAIIDREVEEFRRATCVQQVAPTVRELRSRLEGIRSAEMNRLVARLNDASPEDKELIEETLRRLENKILHLPLRRIRRASHEEGGIDALREIRRLFGLDET